MLRAWSWLGSEDWHRLATPPAPCWLSTGHHSVQPAWLGTGSDEMVTVVMLIHLAVPNVPSGPECLSFTRSFRTMGAETATEWCSFFFGGGVLFSAQKIRLSCHEVPGSLPLPLDLLTKYLLWCETPSEEFSHDWVGQRLPGGVGKHSANPDHPNHPPWTTPHRVRLSTICHCSGGTVHRFCTFGGI